MHILRCMGLNFWLKFQRARLKFQQKVGTHTPKICILLSSIVACELRYLLIMTSQASMRRQHKLVGHWWDAMLVFNTRNNKRVKMKICDYRKTRTLYRRTCLILQFYWIGIYCFENIFRNATNVKIIYWVLICIYNALPCWFSKVFKVLPILMCITKIKIVTTILF